MRTLDFLILLLCCLCWGGNFVISAWALSSAPIPPFFLAFIRSCFAILIMFPFLLRPLPNKWRRLSLVCLFVGPVHLGFLYTGLQTAPASGGSIVSHMLIPFAAILSVIFLNERIGRVRLLAILGALTGTVLMIYEPNTLNFDIGLVWIVCAYLSLAIGSVLMKGVGKVAWQQYVAWMAVLVFLFSGLTTMLFEDGQFYAYEIAKWKLLIAGGYAAVFVSIFAHGQYFGLIKKYDVSMIVPLTLIQTLFACVLGVIFLGEVIYLRYYLGALLIIPCVYVIAKRTPG